MRIPPADDSITVKDMDGDRFGWVVVLGLAEISGCGKGMLCRTSKGGAAFVR